MNELSLNEQKEIQRILSEKKVDVSEGDVFITDKDYSPFIRITKVETVVNDYPKEETVQQRTRVVVRYERARDYEGTEWENGGKYELYELDRFRKLDKPIEVYLSDTKRVINGEISIEELSIPDHDEASQNTSIISKSSKEGLLAIQADMEAKKNRVELIRMFVGVEMSKRKAELDKIRRQLEGTLAVFKKQITRIMRVITTIELYLGIDEEIFQIQDGEKAPDDTPITFRQRVLYMDEEVASTEDGGLDYRNVNIFDNWLIKDDNYKSLLPEQKGVLVFRPRRYMKDYGDAIENMMKKGVNEETYILIRNGECLYRIYTEKIIIYPRLFPRRTELMDLLTKINDTESYYSKQEAEEKTEDLTYQYKKRAILLQGLIDRTDILQPICKPVSVFKMDETPELINFIYDDDNMLPDGRLRFWDWVKENNELISYGSRVVISGDYSYYCRLRHEVNEYFAKRLIGSYREHSFPPPPHQGVYEVEKHIEQNTHRIKKSELNSFLTENNITKYKIIKEYTSYSNDIYCRIKYETGKEFLIIKHNPKDTVYGSWGEWKDEERKNRLSFKINKEDKFIINYDQMDLGDIEFYLNNRADRENYLTMMPLLRNLKKWRLKELENEKYFVSMVIDCLTRDGFINSSSISTEQLVWDAVEWWKFKNMIKRPIDKDDAKALRMIIKKIKNNDQ